MWIRTHFIRVGIAIPVPRDYGLRRCPGRTLNTIVTPRERVLSPSDSCRRTTLRMRKEAHEKSTSVHARTGSVCAAAAAVTIPNNTPGFIKSAADQGLVDPATVITVNVWLKLHNQQKLDRLVAQQTQKNSPNYHRWITQDFINANYGPTAQEVNAVSNFLSAHNLTVLSVAENNLYVKAQGSVSAIQQAFHVQIHGYSRNGAMFRSNAGDPSVSDSSGSLIAAVTGLDDYGFQSNVARPMTPEGVAAPLRAVSGPGGLFFEAQCFRPVETDSFKGGGNMAS